MSRQCHMEFDQFGRDGEARRGAWRFRVARCETPAFMPVGTYGTVKGMLPRDIRAIGAEIILGNTFHLWLRPGTDIIEQHGDLHDFMGWDGPILTDSGGFQVFSLGDMRKISRTVCSFSRRWMAPRYSWTRKRPWLSSAAWARYCYDFR